MDKELTIGEQIAATIRPFIGTKMNGGIDDVVTGLAKTIDRQIAIEVSQFCAKTEMERAGWSFMVAMSGMNVGWHKDYGSCHAETIPELIAEMKKHTPQP